MRTYSPRPAEITRAWYVVDARDQVLGRLATRVATVLRGKHKPEFAPHIDCGDFVIVVNAGEVRLTGDKGRDMMAHRHSGYPGGLTSVPFADLLENDPAELVKRSVRGMLPKNKLARQQLHKLKVYPGPDHPHEAQQPQVLPLS
jgi:large subunit ribosomal protein L13